MAALRRKGSRAFGLGLLSLALLPTAASAQADVHVRMQAAVGVGHAAGPLPHTDFALGGGVRFEEIGAFLTLHYADTFGSGGVEGGYGLRGRLLRARAAFCFLPAPLEMCATGSVGFLEGEASAMSAPLGQAAIGTLGAMLGFTIMFDADFGLSVHGEVAAMLERVSFVVGETTIWTAPPMLLELAVGFVYEL